MIDKLIARRPFLTGIAASLLGAGAAGLPKTAKAQTSSGGTVLTLGGRVGKTNRKPFSEQRDGLFKSLELSFDRAYTFDSAALAALPRKSVKATTKQTGLMRFAGTGLQDVLNAAGAADATGLRFVSLDGYAMDLAGSEINGGWILATHADGEAFGIGDFAPVWLIRNNESKEPPEEETQKWVYAVFYIEVS
jgi:hypothetical protein